MKLKRKTRTEKYSRRIQTVKAIQRNRKKSKKEGNPDKLLPLISNNYVAHCRLNHQRGRYTHLVDGALARDRPCLAMNYAQFWNVCQGG